MTITVSRTPSTPARKHFNYEKELRRNVLKSFERIGFKRVGYNTPTVQFVSTIGQTAPLEFADYKLARAWLINAGAWVEFPHN